MSSRRIAILLIFLPLTSFSQYQFRYLNTLSSLKQDKEVYNADSTLHTGFRPFNSSQVSELIEPTTKEDSRASSFWKKKLWFEHLVDVEQDDYHFTLDPVVNFQVGSSNTPKYLFINTRGYNLQGRIGKKISFYSVFLENQARFPEYVMVYGRSRRVILGQSSLLRGFGEDNDAYDYTYFSGEVSYSPNSTFTFTAGQGRNFIGEGYRSLLLSDGTFSYPFFRITTDVWIFKYVNIWAQLNDHRRDAQVYTGVLAKKYLSTHFLSTQITKRWNFSIFESIVYGDTNQLQGLDVSFLNPVVFYRPVEFAVGSRNGNALLGAQSSYRFRNSSMLYGQFLLDEFQLSSIISSEGSWVNKFAWQLGYKAYDFGQIEGLFLRLEYNAARPFTYSHRVVLTNYAHYGSPLAHPWGSNFHEFLVQGIYQVNRLELDLNISFGIIGNDLNRVNYGADVYSSYETRIGDLGNSIGQGDQGNYFFISQRVAYLLNPASGLKIEGGIRYREFVPENLDGLDSGPMFEGRDLVFFLGLRTELFNSYYDF